MRKIIPMFLPQQGCRQRCTFCHQPHITGATLSTTLTPDHVRAAIDAALREPKSRARGVEFEAALYGGTFTGLDVALQEDLLRAAQTYVDHGWLTGIRISTHPAMFDAQIFDLLASFSVTTVELGVQSFEDDVLAQAQRGHTAADAERAIRQLRGLGIAVGIHLMVGLPGDSDDGALRSTERAMTLGPASVRIHPTLVMRHTRLARWHESGAYTPLTLEQAVETCKAMLLRFQARAIPVIRIGLQPTDSLTHHVIAGPYHPAFRQLVEAALMYDRVTERCAARGVAGGRLTITVAPQDISNLRGQKNANLSRLRQTFNLTDIRVTCDATLPRGECEVSSD
jgi:histone acetyltransferase (RNA polymerase elongator complex component)